MRLSASPRERRVPVAIFPMHRCRTAIDSMMALANIIGSDISFRRLQWSLNRSQSRAADKPAGKYGSEREHDPAKQLGPTFFSDEFAFEIAKTTMAALPVQTAA